jgi:hypothetical protein
MACGSGKRCRGRVRSRAAAQHNTAESVVVKYAFIPLESVCLCLSCSCSAARGQCASVLIDPLLSHPTLHRIRLNGVVVFVPLSGSIITAMPDS